MSSSFSPTVPPARSFEGREQTAGRNGSFVSRVAAVAGLRKRVEVLTAAPGKALTPWDMMDDEDSSFGVTFNLFQRRPAATSAA